MTRDNKVAEMRDVPRGLLDADLASAASRAVLRAMLDAIEGEHERDKRRRKLAAERVAFIERVSRMMSAKVHFTEDDVERVVRRYAALCKESQELGVPTWPPREKA